jgi:hypothetical protein
MSQPRNLLAFFLNNCFTIHLVSVMFWQNNKKMELGLLAVLYALGKKVSQLKGKLKVN